MNPYQILGIEPGESDPKVIRRAYARLIRIHRPDSDPGGFRRVRDAYEAALAWAEEQGGSVQTLLPQEPALPLRPAKGRAPTPPPPASPDLPRVAERDPAEMGGHRTPHEPEATADPRNAAGAGPPAPGDTGAGPSGNAGEPDLEIAEGVGETGGSRRGPASPAPTPFEEKVAHMRRLGAGGPDPARDAALLAAARSLEEERALDPALLAEWQEALIEGLGDRPDLLSLAVSEEAARAELEAGQPAVLAALVEGGWRLENDVLARLGRIWISCADSLSDPLAGDFWFFLGERLAFADNALAVRMAEKAFTLRSQTGSKSTLDRVEALSLVGRTSAGWPKEARFLLGKAVLDGEDAFPDRAAVATTFRLISRLGPDSPLRRFLSAHRPDLLADADRRFPRPPPPPAPAGGFQGWAKGVAVAGLLAALALARWASDSSRPPSRPAPSPYFPRPGIDLPTSDPTAGGKALILIGLHQLAKNLPKERQSAVLSAAVKELFRAPVTPSIAEALGSVARNPDFPAAVRADAALLMGKTRDRAAGPFLVQLVSDPDPGVREAARAAYSSVEFFLDEETRKKIRQAVDGPPLGGGAAGDGPPPAPVHAADLPADGGGPAPPGR